jgi:hypothetical protein
MLWRLVKLNILNFNYNYPNKNKIQVSKIFEFIRNIYGLQNSNENIKNKKRVKHIIWNKTF